jgi:hypothetical protein
MADGSPLIVSTHNMHRGFVIMRLKHHAYYTGNAARPWSRDAMRAVTYVNYSVVDETSDLLAELGYSVRIEEAWLTPHGNIALSGC